MDAEISRWLTRPAKREKRGNWEAYRFLPYSFKVADRVDIYTPDRCDHWVEIEFDAEIRSFNEAPPPIEIAYGGKIHSVRFDMACLRIGGQVSLSRLIDPSDAGNCELDSELDRWARQGGLTIERIAVTDLQSRKTEIENKKDLLHFALASKDLSDPELERQILDFVIDNPGITLAATQQRFFKSDPTLVGGEVARLLMRNQLHCNLSAQRFDRNLGLNPR